MLYQITATNLKRRKYINIIYEVLWIKAYPCSIVITDVQIVNITK